MGAKWGITGGGGIKSIRKAIVGAILAGVGSATALAQAGNADGTAITVTGLVMAVVTGAATWWVRNVEE